MRLFCFLFSPPSLPNVFVKGYTLLLEIICSIVLIDTVSKYCQGAPSSGFYEPSARLYIYQMCKCVNHAPDVSMSRVPAISW